MVSRGHLLYCILLPLLAQVAADVVNKELMSEVMSENLDSSEVGRSEQRPTELHSFPPAILIHLLQAGALGVPPPFRHTASMDNDMAEEEGRALAGDGSEEEEENEHGDVGSPAGVKKRVFCNTFTGCGGRHRNRSRRQDRHRKRRIPGMVKRPFCNSFGCYNGKRSLGASSPFRMGSLSAKHRASFLAQLRAAVIAHRQGLAQKTGAVLAGKRLFCNGYGGCRSGKRSLFSPWMNKMNSVAEDLR